MGDIRDQVLAVQLAAMATATAMIQEKPDLALEIAADPELPEHLVPLYLGQIDALIEIYREHGPQALAQAALTLARRRAGLA